LINKIDIKIGQKIRERRTKLGLSQKTLGDVVGVTYQQIQKYEAAHNKVSAHRLYFIAKALNVPIQFFFKDVKLKDIPVYSKVIKSNIKSKPLKVKDKPKDKID